MAFYNSTARSRDIIVVALVGGPLLSAMMFIAGKPELGFPLLIVGALAAVGVWLSMTVYASKEPWITVGPDGIWYRRDEHLFPWSAMQNVRFARTTGKFASTLVEIRLAQSVQLPKRFAPAKTVEIDLHHLASPLEEVMEAVERFAPTLPRTVQIEQ